MLFFSQVYYTVNCVDSSISKNCAGFYYGQVQSFLNRICFIKHIFLYFSYFTQLIPG